MKSLWNSDSALLYFPFFCSSRKGNWLEVYTTYNVDVLNCKMNDIAQLMVVHSSNYDWNQNNAFVPCLPTIFNEFELCFIKPPCILHFSLCVQMAWRSSNVRLWSDSVKRKIISVHTSLSKFSNIICTVFFVGQSHAISVDFYMSEPFLLCNLNNFNQVWSYGWLSPRQL